MSDALASALIDYMAREFAIERRSVNVNAMELRKHGLLRSTGRGLHAAEMTPRDATNLLLAILGGSYATRASERVIELRRAAPHKWLQWDAKGARYTADGPDLPFVSRLSARFDLGEFLDELLADCTAGGMLAKTFSVTMSSSSIATNFKFSFAMDEAKFEMLFFDTSYATRETALGSRTHQREPAERISGAALAAIGDCLAGRDVPTTGSSEAEG